MKMTKLVLLTKSASARGHSCYDLISNMEPVNYGGGCDTSFRTPDMKNQLLTLYESEDHMQLFQAHAVSVQTHSSF